MTPRVCYYSIANVCSLTNESIGYCWNLMMFGILELLNWVTQNEVTLRVTNSKVFIEILVSSY